MAVSVSTWPMGSQTPVPWCYSVQGRNCSLSRQLEEMPIFLKRLCLLAENFLNALTILPFSPWYVADRTVNHNRGKWMVCSWQGTSRYSRALHFTWQPFHCTINEILHRALLRKHCCAISLIQTGVQSHLSSDMQRFYCIAKYLEGNVLCTHWCVIGPSHQFGDCIYQT